MRTYGQSAYTKLNLYLNHMKNDRLWIEQFVKECVVDIMQANS